MPANKVSEVESVVHIINLKDEYDKKTKKTHLGLDYCLDEAEVTVVVQASDTIIRVRAYTQMCPHAAIQTNDITGWSLNVYLIVCEVQVHRITTLNTIALGYRCSPNPTSAFKLFALETLF